MKNKLIRFLKDDLYRFNCLAILGFYNRLSDIDFVKRKYYLCFGKELNLNRPQTINEKYQWIKLYDRNPLYTILVDKYKVREYVKRTIGEEYLIPLLGVWNNENEIDFNSLPSEFVLKCNHNSGLGMCICTDKSKINIKKVKQDLKKGLKENYYLLGREWPYKNVPRKIICEKYIVGSLDSEQLEDYKFYCFDGIVQFMMIATDRNSKSPTKADFFDREFNHLEFSWGYDLSTKLPNKPKNFENMIEIAEQLSKGIPHVRVDLYNCNGKIYFGELTFFDGSGFDLIEPEDYDYKIGKLLKLPIKKE